MTRRTLVLGCISMPLAWLGCGSKPTPEQRAVDLFVASDGDLLAFKPDALTCPSGARVHLTFHHEGKFLSARHDWILTYPDKLEALSQQLLDTCGDFAKNDPRIIAVTPLADKGQSVTTDFIAPAPGDYPFLCSTHPEDMRGILHVTRQG
jgi:plastocyanin